MYWVSVFTEAGIFAILALGLDVVWGWSGDFDLAFYGYLALGSYLTFVLTTGRPTPPGTRSRPRTAAGPRRFRRHEPAR